MMRLIRSAAAAVLLTALLAGLTACQSAPGSLSPSVQPPAAQSREETAPNQSQEETAPAQAPAPEPDAPVPLPENVPSQSPADPEPAPDPEPEPAAPPETEPAAPPDPAPDPVSPPEPAQEPEPEPVPATEPEPEVPVQSELPETENHTLYILMYHHMVEDGQNYNTWTITTSRFREDLQWLRDNGYTWLLPSQLAAGEPLPAKAVLITFDDGYASNYQLAFPILQEFQAKAVISLITRHVEDQDPDFLSWDMCREMAASGLVEFGSHTYDSHGEDPRGIKRASGERRTAYEARVFPDIQASIDQIQENLGTEVLFFAYPHGQTERWASDFLREHFAITVTTRHGPADLSRGLYDLPRHNITVEHPVSEFLK